MSSNSIRRHPNGEPRMPSLATAGSGSARVGHFHPQVRSFVLLVFATLIVLAGQAHAAASYTVVDLGTLGGTFSYAARVNANGQVVGGSTTAGEAELHAFLWAAAGGMVDLGTLGGTSSFASGVNANGQVVGGSTTAGDAELHAFLWTAAGGMVDLGSLPGVTFSYAVAVNDSGQVLVQTSSHSALWTQSGGMVDLGTLGGGSFPASINASGQVVGSEYNEGEGRYHVFSWTAAGGMVDIGTLGGDYSELDSGFRFVNDSGQVVGSSSTASGAIHAFSWTAGGGMIDLGSLSGEWDYSAARAVSTSGQVVGQALVGNDVLHAFSWTPSGGMIDLGSPPPGGDANVNPTDVNATGLVVGFSEPYCCGGGPFRAFAWTAAGGMIELPGLGGSLNSAGAVNDSGQVVGSSKTVGDAETHAVVWQPTVYNFTGFFRPVENLPVLNGLKAGSAVPIKFSLGGDQGLNVFATGYPKSQTIACDPNVLVLGIDETVTAGGSSLSYDATTTEYTYVWKTNSAWKNTCRQFVTVFKDGTIHRADFKFKN